MSDWRDDPFNLAGDPTRPTTGQIVRNVLNPWAWATVWTAASIDISLRIVNTISEAARQCGGRSR